TELGIAETPVTPESKDDSNPIRPLTEVITERAAGRVRLDRIGERGQSDPRLPGELAGHGGGAGAEADGQRIAGSSARRGAGARGRQRRAARVARGRGRDPSGPGRTAARDALDCRVKGPSTSSP